MHNALVAGEIRAQVKDRDYALAGLLRPRKNGGTTILFGPKSVPASSCARA